MQTGIDTPESFIRLKLSRNFKAQISIGCNFIFLGFFFRNLSAIIPSLKIRHNLDDKQLGLVLTFFLGGAVLFGPLAAFCSAILGSGRAVFVGSIICIFAMPTIGAAPNVHLLAASFVLLGSSVAFIDCSMNSLAILCQKFNNRSMIGRFHFTYAIGMILGALFGGSVIEMKVSPLQDLAVLSTIDAILSISSYFWLFSLEEELAINMGWEQQQSLESNTVCSSMSMLYSEAGLLHKRSGYGVDFGIVEEVDKPTTPTLGIIERVVNLDFNERECKAAEGTKLNRQKTKENTFPKNSIKHVVILCAIGAIGYFGEGSVSNWSAVYLKFVLGSNFFVGSLGVVFFQLSIAIIRFFTDGIVENINSKVILFCCGLISMAGIGLVVLSPNTTWPIFCSIAGFSLTGIGIAMVTPIVMSIAGTTSINGMRASDTIATVNSVAYIGLLVGPPLTGCFSHMLGSLRWALILNGCLLGLISFLAFGIKDEKPLFIKITSHESLAPML